MMDSVIVLALLALAQGPLPSRTESTMTGVNISALLKSFEDGYDRRVRPNYGGPAVEVGVTMFIISISSVSEVEMDFTLDMYFRQFWKDPRLSFDLEGLKKLVVGAEFIEKIWVPDTFFPNEKTAYFHKATTENQFLRISASGDILRSQRLTITSSCPMNLEYFPMDRQLCKVMIESFGYSTLHISYLWQEGLKSVQISPDVELPQFKVMGHKQLDILEQLSTGNYSRLICEIQFIRSMGYYLIQIYVPSSLIVVISWVSFWLNRGATPARVSLGVTTVLTMTTLMASTNAALPKISYVKSIDIYLGACFFMVFASLIEYASVGYMAKRIQMRKNRFLAFQQMAEQKKKEAMNAAAAVAAAAGMNDLADHHGVPKQTTVHFKVHEGKLHGGCKSSKETNTTLGGGGRYVGNSSKYGGHQTHPYGGQGGIPLRGLSVGSVSSVGRFEEEHGPPPPFPPRPPPPPPPLGPPPNPECDMKELNKMFGMTASDIDKYSRIIFPVTFVCFQLCYWIIYQHLSDHVVSDLVPLIQE